MERDLQRWVTISQRASQLSSMITWARVLRTAASSHIESHLNSDRVKRQQGRARRSTKHENTQADVLVYSTVSSWSARNVSSGTHGFVRSSHVEKPPSSQLSSASKRDGYFGVNGKCPTKKDHSLIACVATTLHDKMGTDTSG